jgi:hypothetical protein
MFILCTLYRASFELCDYSEWRTGKDVNRTDRGPFKNYQNIVPVVTE